MKLQFGFAPLDREPHVITKVASAGTAACLAEAVTFPLDIAKVRLMVSKKLLHAHHGLLLLQ